MFRAEELCSEEPCNEELLPELLPPEVEFTAAAAAVESESAEGDSPEVRLIFARRFLNQN